MKTRARAIASVKIWVVIYPSITLFLALAGEYLAQLPLYLRTLVLTIVLVPWMVFAGIPMVELLLKRIVMKNKSEEDVRH